MQEDHSQDSASRTTPEWGRHVLTLLIPEAGPTTVTVVLLPSVLCQVSILIWQRCCLSFLPGGGGGSRFWGTSLLLPEAGWHM